MNSFNEEDESTAPRKEKPAPGLAEIEPEKMNRSQLTAKTRPQPEPSERKILLARAYGSERARAIQPERGLVPDAVFL